MGIVKSIKDKIVGADNSAETHPLSFTGESKAGEPPKVRTVIEAETLSASEPADAPKPKDGIRIKALPQPMGDSCRFAIDRPVLPGYSWSFPDPESKSDSPLAERLFSLKEVESFQAHESQVIVSRRYSPDTDWEELARKIGEHIRAHLQSGQPALDPETLAKIPGESTVRAEVQAVIDEEINPALAGHEGMVSLDKVEGNTVVLSMGGGCQGCGGAAQTLKFGIERALRERIPYLGLVLDQTDHAAGQNPYF